VAAEASSSKDGGKAFMKLAGYIGVLSAPKNTARPHSASSTSGSPEAVAITVPVISEPIAMTVPVISEPIAMTTPVVSEGSGDAETMKFILPSKYRKAEDAPIPNDPSVQLSDVPEKFMAALQFSGRCDGRETAIVHYEELQKKMKEFGLEPAGPWELHRFNPPYTLAAFRTNEIIVPINKDSLAALGVAVDEE